MTPQEIVVKVYSLARKVSKILQDNNILFWTSGGTTLGLFVKSNVMFMIKKDCCRNM